MQLVARGIHDSDHPHSTADPITNRILFTRFGQRLAQDAERYGDAIEGSFLSFKLPPLPEGFTWKRNAHLRFIKYAGLEIGGVVIDFVTNDAMEILHEAHDDIFHSPQINADGSIEVSIPLFENISPIHLINLAYNMVRYDILLEDIQNLVDGPAGEMARLADYTFIGDLVHRYVFLDSEERPRIVRTNTNTPYVSHCATVSEIVSISPQSRFHRVNLPIGGISPYAMILVRDEHGNPIQESVLEEVNSTINGHARFSRLTGYESRTTMKRDCPACFRFRVRPIQRDCPATFRTQTDPNLYFISYNHNRAHNNNGLYDGMNLSRIDSYHVTFKVTEEAARRYGALKVIISHQTTNTFRTAQGLGGLMYSLAMTPSTVGIADIAGGLPVIRSVPVSPPEPTRVDAIEISPGTECIIMAVEIEEGAEVDQCQRCKKVFLTSAMQQWQQSTINAGTRACPHCREPYTRDSFHRGTALIVP